MSSAGAMKKQDQAKLEADIGAEIEAMKPVHKDMGIFSFLPFNVPFLEQVLHHAAQHR